MKDKKILEEVTTPEAAQYLGVTPPHIRLLYYKDVLRGEKRGRDLWITKESLDEYKKHRRTSGVSESASINANISGRCEKVRSPVRRRARS
jgi:excisionase family DNA binding protein